MWTQMKQMIPYAILTAVSLWLAHFASETAVAVHGDVCALWPSDLQPWPWLFLFQVTHRALLFCVPAAYLVLGVVARRHAKASHPITVAIAATLGMVVFALYALFLTVPMASRAPFW
jgi:hypothetical protein